MFSPHALRGSARRIQLVIEVSTIVTESHRLSGGTLQAEGSTAGSALAVVGTAVVAKVCELVNTVSVTAMITIASARNFIVVMLPRSSDGMVPHTDTRHLLTVKDWRVDGDGATSSYGHTLGTPT
jgi:hypothetical protein